MRIAIGCSMGECGVCVNGIVLLCLFQPQVMKKLSSKINFPCTLSSGNSFHCNITAAWHGRVRKANNTISNGLMCVLCKTHRENEKCLRNLRCELANDYMYVTFWAASLSTCRHLGHSATLYGVKVCAFGFQLQSTDASHPNTCRTM